MRIKSLLIAPPARLIPPEFYSWQKIKNIIHTPTRIYDGELIFWSDIPKILGQQNTFVIGGIHPHLFDSKVPHDCPYPSSHGTPPFKSIKMSQLDQVISNVDGLLLSSRFPQPKTIIKSARSHNKVIAIVDFPDHEELYGTSPSHDIIYRSFKKGNDFDIYFKKDMQTKYNNDYTFPLEPAPVRPSSYNFPELQQNSPIFYSGRSRQEKVQPERSEVVTLIKNNFPEANIIDHSDRSSFMTTSEYQTNLSASKMALSPSGRIWGSFRHCETGLTPNTALIAPKPYIEIAGIAPTDDVNALIYDVREVNGRYHLASPEKLIQKIEHYLKNPPDLIRIAKQWNKDVLTSHTIYARSSYILETLNAFL